MPKSKKAIHELFSPKIAAKRKRRKEVAEARAREASKPKSSLEAPATIDNYKVNKPFVSLNKVRRLQAKAPVVQRKISPTEGKPAVNGKVGDKVKRLIHKPVSKKVHDPSAGAIKAIPKDKAKKSRGRPKRSKPSAK